MSDRVSVNHCVWLKLEELFQHTLLELKCNVHPLDGISNKIRITLKVYDNDNGIQSCTFGSDCAVALSTFCVVKMLSHAGTVIPYVGNRFNVLFWLEIFLRSKIDYCTICKICVTAKTV